MFGQSDVGRHPLPPDLGFENLRLSVAELPSIPLIFPWSWRQSSAQFAINRSVFFGVSLIFSIQKISFIQLYLVWTRCYLVTRWDKDRAIRASSCCCVAPPPILLRNPWHFTSEPFHQIPIAAMYDTNISISFRQDLPSSPGSINDIVGDVAFQSQLLSGGICHPLQQNSSACGIMDISSGAGFNEYQEDSQALNAGFLQEVRSNFLFRCM